MKNQRYFDQTNGNFSARRSTPVTPTTASQLLQLWKQQPSSSSSLLLQQQQQQSVVPTMPLPPKIPILLTSSSSTIHTIPKNNQWLELHGNNGIVEIAGEAGSGKTQLCLSLCLNVIMNHEPSITDCHFHGNGGTHSNTTSSAGTTHSGKRSHSLISNNNEHEHEHEHDDVVTTTSTTARTMTAHSHVLYVSLGETTSTSQMAHRLHQMVRERMIIMKSSASSTTSSSSHHSSQENSSNTISCEEHIQNVMKRIHMKRIHNTEDFLSFLQHELPTTLSHHRDNTNDSTTIGLIVLDSIAGLYRIPEEHHDDKDAPKTTVTQVTQSHNRSTTSKYYYAQRSETFFDIASKLKYISDVYGTHVIVVNQVTGKGNGKHVPSLGLSWSHCVNERYLLSRTERMASTAGVSTTLSSSSTNRHSHDDDNVHEENPNVPNLFERRICLIASSKRRINVSTKFCISASGVYECS